MLCYFSFVEINKRRPNSTANSFSVDKEVIDYGNEEIGQDDDTTESKYTIIGNADYIPIEEVNKQSASFILSYSHVRGANRPHLEVQFADETKLYFNAVCDGDYSWCIVDIDNEPVGSMNLEFQNRGEFGFIKIKRDRLAKNYDTALNLLSGGIRRR